MSQPQVETPEVVQEGFYRLAYVAMLNSDHNNIDNFDAASGDFVKNGSPVADEFNFHSLFENHVKDKMKSSSLLTEDVLKSYIIRTSTDYLNKLIKKRMMIPEQVATKYSLSEPDWREGGVGAQDMEEFYAGQVSDMVSEESSRVTGHQGEGRRHKRTFKKRNSKLLRKSKRRLFNKKRRKSSRRKSSRRKSWRKSSRRKSNRRKSSRYYKNKFMRGGMESGESGTPDGGPPTGRYKYYPPKMPGRVPVVRTKLEQEQARLAAPEAPVRPIRGPGSGRTTPPLPKSGSGRIL